MLKYLITPCVLPGPQVKRYCLTFPSPQQIPSGQMLHLWIMTSRATRKLWFTLYSLHWDTDGWGHRSHLISGMQELSTYIWTVWPPLSLPKDSKTPQSPSSKICFLPKWSQMLISDALEAQVSITDWGTGTQVVLFGYKEQSWSMVWAGAHPVSPTYTEVKQEGEQDLLLTSSYRRWTQFILLSVTQRQGPSAYKLWSSKLFNPWRCTRQWQCVKLPVKSRSSPGLHLVVSGSA